MDSRAGGPFGRAAEYIEALAVDREDLAYVRMRVEAMLAWHTIRPPVTADQRYRIDWRWAHRFILHAWGRALAS